MQRAVKGAGQKLHSIIFKGDRWAVKQLHHMNIIIQPDQWRDIIIGEISIGIRCQLRQLSLIHFTICKTCHHPARQFGVGQIAHRGNLIRGKGRIAGWQIQAAIAGQAAQ